MHVYVYVYVVCSCTIIYCSVLLLATDGVVDHLDLSNIYEGSTPVLIFIAFCSKTKSPKSIIN